MIPLVIGAAVFSALGYFFLSKLRHKKATLGGLAAAAVVGGLTGGFGGAALDTLFAAPLFAAEGAVAGTVENALEKPVEHVWDDLFGHHAKPAPQGDTAGSSGLAAISPVTSGDAVTGIAYQTKPGDTVSGLAARAGVTTGVLVAANPSLESAGSDQLAPGQNIEVPCPVGASSAGCVDALAKAFGSGN
ncbi:MAG TPA: LysM domain-containing protein [Planctomycetota bacterium]|nr:LysM domain-containing protein [Planctomycetota bacterium]